MSEIKVDNQSINVTHEDKILFPAGNITKLELVSYYLKIADYMLPFLADHPITIHCYPQSIEMKGFIRQHAPNRVPKYLQTIQLKKKEGGKLTHILCQNKASLVYLANQNTIEIHRWLSSYSTPVYPDIMIIDIDPMEGQFNLACKGAKFLKERIEALKLKPYIMLTGSKGLHVVIPVKGKMTFDKVRDFLYSIITDLINTYPEEFTSNIQKEKRHNGVYLDLLRNVYGQTAIAPYSVRAKKEASIATPLAWDELDDPQLSPKKYTIKNIFSRLKASRIDPWEGF